MSIQAFLTELEAETPATKNLLDVLPAGRLTWKPHEKAMSLGQLAFHVATLPGRNVTIADQGEISVTELVKHPQPAGKAEIIEGFTQSVQTAKDILSSTPEGWLDGLWSLRNEQKAIAQMPRAQFCRVFIFNHWYHHRGQLSTYLRTLDVALPSVYGPTADVNPFQ